jgi:hypothetical protein
MTYQTPPEGWFTFGTHVDIPGPLEFSTETDEAGMPLWERPAPARDESEHSICWMCGQDVDHATGHDCPMDDGS